MIRAGRLIVVAALTTATLAMPVVRSGALVPNASLFFYRSTPAPNGVRATLNNGTYVKKGTSTVATGFTHVVVSRDTMLLYNKNTGAAVTGTYVGGVFTKKHTYALPHGWSNIAAGCDTVVFFNATTRDDVMGTLTGGAYHPTTSGQLPSATTLAASCDTLLGYNRKGGGWTEEMSSGQFQHLPMAYSFPSDWTSVTATADSVLFYAKSTGSTALGVLTAGRFTPTRTTHTALGVTNVAGTTNSLLFYKAGSSSAVVRTLVNGALGNQHSVSGLATNWSIITGGK